MRRRAAVLALAATMGLAACTPAPAPETAAARTMLTTTATVLSADPDRRALVLRDAQTGRTFPVTADAATGDLSDIAPGDVIMINYFASFSLAPAPPGDPGTPVALADDAPTPVGGGPGGVAVETTSVVVDFLGYDEATGEATVSGPAGSVRRIPLASPLDAFARGLSPGDRVLVTLTEAVALSVTPAGG